MKMSSFLSILISATLMLTGCGGGNTGKDTEKDAGKTPNKVEDKDTNKNPNKGEEDIKVTNETNPIVTIEMENGDKMYAELYPDVAPNTVNNFIALVEDGFYNGLIFHRVIPGFMIQGGDPNGTGMGGPGYGINGEFSQNGFENNLKHTKGVLSMARSQSPNSAGSQFFLMVDDAPHLDGAYAGFGKIVKGIEIADKIVAVDRDSNDKPNKDQKIKKMTVDTKGKKYDKPKTNSEK